MKKKTILITTSSFGKFDSLPIDLVEEAGFKIIKNPKGRKLTESEVLKLIEEYNPHGILAGVEPLTEKVFNNAQELKAISRVGIGMDSVDLKTAEALGISVTNTPDAPTIPVAELTIGMILTLLRKIHIADASIRIGKWERPMGDLLYGKTVGIIGCGRIGKMTASYLKAFGVDVIGYDPALQCNKDIAIVGLTELLANSHIVTLHIPYSFENHHFINAKRLSSMKRGSFLINAARGGLVDEDALYYELNSGHIAGAAIDCFEEEPYKGPLRELSNILLTSHIGSYARQARVLMETQAVENLLHQLRG